jgi:hypothetical protein
MGTQIMAVGGLGPVQSRFESSVPSSTPFGSASTPPWYGGKAWIGTGGGLHAVVAQQARASPCQGEGRPFKPGQPLTVIASARAPVVPHPVSCDSPGDAPVAESGRRASLRNWCPRGREGPNPSWGTRCGASPRKWACPVPGPSRWVLKAPRA